MPLSIENQRQGLAPDTQTRVLVADDDPASLLFLTEALRALGLDAVGCTDSANAAERAIAEPFQLLMLDCRMPGGGAESILHRVRDAGCNTLAVATSAEFDEPTRQRLYACGFQDLLLKPCQQADLRRIASLVDPTLAAQDVLDDTQAIASSGDAQVMQALRGLMREELLQLEREWDGMAQNPARLRERLHRLLASCGFCGTALLAARTALLQQQLVGGQVPTPGSIAGFRSALRATIDALQDSVPVR
ncbi:MAG TPA: response regulator [Dyella sp.]|uniref:response regulator n=1 Tax=Dyella sp. TaxID=1869338 RepID=UPI002F91C5C7